MPSTLKFDHEFAGAVVGTPPFIFTIWCYSPSGSTDEGEISDVKDIVRAAYNDNIAPILWDGLHAGVLKITLDDGSEVVEFASTLDNGGSGAQSYAPQVAIRAKFLALRPPKGRLNSCYFPLPNADNVNQEGTVDSTAQSAVETWGTDLLAVAGVGDWAWSSRHQVGGPTAAITWRSNLGAAAAPTASYLRGRYR